MTRGPWSQSGTVVAILLLALAGAVAAQWECPACGTGTEGEICAACGIPRPPAGMAYIPPCTVEVAGSGVALPHFFVDSTHVTYRELLPWAGSEIAFTDEIQVFLGGQEELLMSGASLGEQYAGMVFVRYSPWVVNTDGGGNVQSLTVQTGCFDLPAASMTWAATELYLRTRGCRLPTLAEMHALTEAGLVEPVDAWETMSAYGTFLNMTLSGVLGVGLAELSMFESGDPDDRIMWEWTRDAWAQPPDSLSDLEGPGGTIVRPVDGLEVGTARRDAGYYNVVFRGVMPLPSE